MGSSRYMNSCRLHSSLPRAMKTRFTFHLVLGDVTPALTAHQGRLLLKVITVEILVCTRLFFLEVVNISGNKHIFL